MIEQPAGRRHDDVHALAQVGNLGIDAHSAVDDGCAKPQITPVGADAFRNLRRQLSRRCEYEGADPPPIHTALLEPLQQGQREAGRLAGARLRAREYVVAGENGRYSLLLDRRRPGIALLFDRTQQFGREAEFFE